MKNTTKPIKAAEKTGNKNNTSKSEAKNTICGIISMRINTNGVTRKAIKQLLIR